MWSLRPNNMLVSSTLTCVWYISAPPLLWTLNRKLKGQQGWCQGSFCVPSLSPDDVCLTCVPISCPWCCLLVQCFSEDPQSPLKPVYTSRKSMSEFFHSSPPFPHQSCLQGESSQIPLYSLEKWWKDLMGHAGGSWSVAVAQRCRSLFQVGTGWACRCSLLPCLLRRRETGRALEWWWSLGHISPPPHHFLNVKTVKVGGFGSGMFCHGAADELGLG